MLMLSMATSAVLAEDSYMDITPYWWLSNETVTVYVVPDNGSKIRTELGATDELMIRFNGSGTEANCFLLHATPTNSTAHNDLKAGIYPLGNFSAKFFDISASNNLSVRLWKGCQNTQGSHGWPTCDSYAGQLSIRHAKIDAKFLQVWQPISWQKEK